MLHALCNKRQYLQVKLGVPSGKASFKKILCLILPSTILIHNSSFAVQVLIDSGSEQNLISPAFIRLHNIPLQQLPFPMTIPALDGRSLAAITQKTLQLTLITSGNHHEHTLFLSFQQQTCPYFLIRGHNAIAIKNKYSLPLITSTFESVEEVFIFTKVDMCNAYHVIRNQEGDGWKTLWTLCVPGTAIQLD